ncbi:MAG: Ldh family oxidoreductase, partial [Alphaproteobacteria bacterium]|nr:Ldh family oxidoreductase [Alphaproteobacteria bacterium]
ASNARPVADSVRDAEAEGLRNVGLGYLPIYCDHLRCGKVDGWAKPILRRQAPAVLAVDAAHGFCHPAYELAERELIALSGEFGIACLSISRSYSAGVVGWFVDRLARQGLVSLAFANSSALVAPWGGSRPFFGTNPIALGAPRERQPPLVIDMSSSATARINVIEAAKSGGPIPAGWALDRQGKPTTDPQAALEGTVSPLGGYKGTGLALIVEVLAAGLTGAQWAHQADSFTDNTGGPPSVGQLFIALSPARLGMPKLGQRIEAMLAAMVAGSDARVPGDRRHTARARAEREGVDVPDALLATLNAYRQ